MHADPWVVAGDFNLIDDLSGKNNERINHRMTGKFRRMLMELELKDLYLAGGEATTSWNVKFQIMIANEVILRLDITMESKSIVHLRCKCPQRKEVSIANGLKTNNPFTEKTSDSLTPVMSASRSEGDEALVNEVLTDDELRAVLTRLRPESERDAFGLVCRRWLRIQSSERRRLRARAGPSMLRRLAARFPGILELDLSQSPSRSFYPGVIDDDLDVIAGGFCNLRVLALQNCKGHHLSTPTHVRVKAQDPMRIGRRRRPVHRNLPGGDAKDIGIGWKGLQVAVAASYPAGVLVEEHAGLMQRPGIFLEGRFRRRLYYAGYCLRPENSTLVEIFVALVKCLVLYAGITDVGMVKLGEGLQCLQTLDVSHCKKLSDKGLKVIASGCQKLRQLHIAGCRLITDNLLHAVSKNCLNLEELGAAGCNSITDAGISALADGCHKMKSLDISKCNKVGDPGICKIAEVSSSSLLSLKLLDCSKVGNKSIYSLAKFCCNLETLIIGGCRDISDDSIEALALACCSSLRILRMDWCLKITDASLRSLLCNCKLLAAIDVGCCDQITDAAFQGMEANLFRSELRVLKINNCVDLTVVGVSSVIESCKALEYLDVRSCPQVTRQSCEEAGLQLPGGCKVNFEGSLSESDPSVDRFF
ncbi:unnamed protein product [Triticum turgidum subsp. durum]|uniref:F-box/LRR-repeat protein 15-like leucin rich repeat domain-containing protein n=1 Tax=Triticum turgidum subsp. durum TaxID=4567 RepID=A0A9R1B0W9_TRITD|nr:unnamed protein product [Triticum turgidum subsp. durum]